MRVKIGDENAIADLNNGLAVMHSCSTGAMLPFRPKAFQFLANLLDNRIWICP